MSQEQKVKEILELEALRDAYERVPPLVWQDLWTRFCGISFDANAQVMSFKEGNRQVVNYMLAMAGKLNFEEMEALWKQVKGNRQEQ